MMTREPLLSVGGITAAVAAVLALLTAVGLDLSPALTTTITGLVSVLAPLVVVVLARRKVTPTADPRAADGTPLVSLGRFDR